jgi:protein MpaA
MRPLYKPVLVAGFCCLLISCSELPFFQQQSPEEPEAEAPEPISAPTETAPENDTPTSSTEAEVTTIPVGSRETIVSTPESETTPQDTGDEPEVLPAPQPEQEESDPSAHEDPVATSPEPTTEPTDDSSKLIEDLCRQIGSKLTSVSTRECNSQKLVHSELSQEGRSLAYRDYPPLASREPLGRVLVIGGIHGDEFSSVSVVFKWMNILNQFHSGLFHWRFIPASNPDGLLIEDSQRQNARGVDLNRNFPTADWDNLAKEYWIERTYRNPRRYPGESAMSEPETKFLVNQIRDFDPDIIISMHAPYHLVDYDGPPSAPNKLGGLYLRELGVYPGSLGNYFGVDKANPIVTIELKSAGIMPSDQEIDRMWTDLVRWLRGQLED